MKPRSTRPLGLLALALVLVAALTVAPRALGIVAVDTWTNISSTAPTNTTGTITPAAFTVGAGTQRLLVVAATCELSAASTMTTFSVTYGGIGMTQIATTAAISQREHAAMWYLPEASIPGGANSVVLSYTTSGGNVTGMHIDRASYAGVEQSAPVNGSAANSSAATNVTFGTAVNYLVNGINVYIASNGGTPATIPTPPGDFATVAAATTTTSGFTSFIGLSPVEAAAGSYVAGTTITFGGTTSARSAVAVAAISSATTTVGNGTNPGNASLCPGGAATMLDSFTLQTSSGTDAITGVTVTLAAGTFAGISLVEITNDAGTVVYGSVADPTSATVAVTTAGLSATTTSTQYKVRITPKTHANMPAPAGATYAVTGTVTAITNSAADVLNDTGSATVTIDNASPANPTGFTGVVGGAGISLFWTNPGDADFNSVTILRNTVPVTDVPVEGTAYVAGNTIGTSTVVYVGSGTSFMDAGPFAAGTYYSYRIFARDNCVNYSTGAAAGPYLAVAAQADVSIAKSGSVGSTTVGGTLTYTLVVTNNGPNTATAVSVSDTIPPGMGLNGAVTTTQGTCTGTTTVTCNVGSMVNGATVTITIPVINNSSGTKSNTATVSDAGTGDFDPNTTNNSSTVLTTVTGAASILCATPGKDGPGGVLSTVVNTYYPPGTGTVFAGVANTCIPVGTPSGSATLVSAGDLLLVIQMQDADIDSSNTTNYGGANGTGAGALSVNAGKYEYVRADGPVTAGCIPITGTGANNGLVNGYQNGDATATKGAMRYQVIRVPQYTTATLGGVTASPWTTLTTATNQYGTGGVLVMDVQGALTVNSGVAATVDGLGFRGGAGRQLAGDAVAPAALDTWTNSSSTAPGNTNGTVTTGAFTVSAGTNRILVAAAAAELSAASTLTAFSMTYGGVAMHPIGTTAATSSQQHAGMWYLLESEIPGGANTFVLTYNTGSAATVTGVHVKRASYTGVDQVNAVNDSTTNTNAAANVTFGSQVDYLATNINVYIGANGGTPATVTAPGDLATVAAATTTTSGFSSFIGQSPNEGAAGNYAAATNVAFGGTTQTRSAVVAASLGFGLTNTDWRTSSTRTTNGGKGEGIGGTPEWLQAVTGPFQTNQPFDGYPGGSYARGAPANAGGGSTDDNPTANDRNSGGGGGSNGGAGGTGGFSWSTCLDRGGKGAAVTPAITKLVMGGGGGAGTRNNSPGDVQAAGGAAGGGLMVIRAAQLVINSGAIISANGANAYNGTLNDGGGGGGAGGSVILTVSTGTMSGLTIRARGGTGGDDWLTQPGGGGGGCDGIDPDHHGPGGGGGGGVIVYTNTAVPPTLDVTGGTPGRTTTDLNTFGAQAGGLGQILFIGPGSVPGGGSGAECSPDPAITLTHTGTTLTPGGTGTVLATVTNAGPFIATSGLVTAVITLSSGPPILTPTAASGSGWSCSIAGQVVTCTRSDVLAAQQSYPPISISVNVGGTGPATLTNTATVANAGDINTANNSASDPIGIAAPTLAELGPVRVRNVPGGVVVSFRTAYEVSNLGFQVIREDGGVARDLTASLLAGSALFAGQNVTLTAGRRYRFVDPEPAGPDTRYYLQEIDLTGRSRYHGPFFAEDGRDDDPGAPSSPTLAALSRAKDVVTGREGMGLERRAGAPAPEAGIVAITQAQLADMPAAKISVSREGWYRVTKAALVAAGYDPGRDPSTIQLFAETREQAIVVRDGGDGVFDSGDSIEFYGYGLDTASTDKRVYWLISGRGLGQRVPTGDQAKSPPAAGASFPFTTVRKDRVLFFAALTTNGDRENFFGPAVGPSDTTISVATPDVVPADGDAVLEVALQGATSQEHQVSVTIGGHYLGTLMGNGKEAPRATYPVPSAWLAPSNDVVLRSLAGAGDYSAVDSLRLTYPRAYAAQGDLLAFSTNPSSRVSVSGFSTADVRILDVTNPVRPVELPVTVTGKATFTASATVPADGGKRLLAFTAAQALAPQSVVLNVASHWSSSKSAAKMVVVGDAALLEAAKSLAAARAAEGIPTVLVDLADVYDEFSYGEKDPTAIRSFFLRAATGWATKPQYALLLGDGSIDPRNYLGFGDTDLVPTKLVPTAFMKTASDDWFADFAGTGVPGLSLGRLPARTLAEATAMVGKVLAHDRGASRLSTVLLASDQDDLFDFDAAADGFGAGAVPPFVVQRLSLARLGSGMHDALVQALNAGPAIAAFVGHASEATLGFHTLFDGTDATALTNGTKLPIFIGVNCLNGYFHDVYVESLGESILKAPGGGASAVWASSALTDPEAQVPMMNAFFPLLFSKSVTRLGDAVRQAKPFAVDQDVRRSWILLGDPSMRVR